MLLAALLYDGRLPAGFERDQVRPVWPVRSSQAVGGASAAAEGRAVAESLADSAAALVFFAVGDAG